MKLTAKVKLQPTPEQHDSLVRTLEVANDACNQISGIAWAERTFSKFAIQKLVYHDIKGTSGLSAQMVVRCISKVSDAYKPDKKIRRTFSPHGAIAYDGRILKWYIGKQEVSIWSVDGRLKKLPFVCGERQKELLQNQQGESDLCLINGELYLFATCDVESPTPDDVTEFLGVDLGIKNIAVTSDDVTFSGAELEAKRQWFADRKTTLQKVGTLSAKRRLRKLKGKQSKFQKKTNHEIAKRIVEMAKDTGRGIALEDLEGIRGRITVRKSQRSRHHNWPFYQLQQYILYKAELAGIPVVLVDPRNTSKTCNKCGHCEKSNRKNRDDFACKACGYAVPADLNAAVNIAARVCL